VELASRGLTLDAINGIVAELLPPEFQRALEEFDAVQCELGPQAEFPSETFTVVAARGGDDVWLEVRRRRIADEDKVPDEFLPPPAAGTHTASAATLANDDFVALDESGAPLPGAAPPMVVAPSAARVVEPQPAPSRERAESTAFELDDDLLLPDATQLWGASQPEAARLAEHQDDDAIPLTMIEPIDEEPQPVPVAASPPPAPAAPVFSPP